MKSKGGEQLDNRLSSFVIWKYKTDTDLIYETLDEFKKEITSVFDWITIDECNSSNTVCVIYVKHTNRTGLIDYLYHIQNKYRFCWHELIIPTYI